MKIYSKILLLLLWPFFSIAQYNSSYWEELTKSEADSLGWVFRESANDTLRMAMARGIGFYYIEINRDSALYFFDYQLKIARQLKLRLWEADALDNMGYVSGQLKNYSKALQFFIEALKIAENKESEKNIWRVSKFSISGKPEDARLNVLGFIYNDMGGLYVATGDIGKAISNTLEAKEIATRIYEPTLLSITNANLGQMYMQLNKLDSALEFAQRALDFSLSSGFKKYRGQILTLTGNIYFSKKEYDSSKLYFARAYQSSKLENNLDDFAQASIALANLFTSTGNTDSSLLYAKKGLEVYQSLGSPNGLITAYTSLSAAYKLRNNLDSAFIFQGLAMVAKDNLNSLEKLNQFQNVGFDEQLRVQELEKEKIENQNKTKTYGLLAGVVVFMLIAFLLFRNNRIRKKANTQLKQQNDEIESTLTKLKATQTQLIHAEKMASLGELTAGIAHEIQNPLNFVNNFSELNKELLLEMKAEIDNGKLDNVKALANDIIENQDKINHHGKRADAIVKGMLQHSRNSTAVKEATDINKLADEYLRLAYHGLKAKDKSFNATLKTDFDERIGKINIIPQDIGRAVLNLITNAFYAVGEKRKQAGNGYEPTVSVKTRKVENKVEISVSDNGSGISQRVLEKIFQPFFTTKPTGQGTGLGLSLSYDIIKAHGGELKVNTKEGEATEFVIQLPFA